MSCPESNQNSSIDDYGVIYEVGSRKSPWPFV